MKGLKGMKDKDNIKSHLIMGGTVILGICIGTAGMLYATSQDRKQQENKQVEVVMPIHKSIGSPKTNIEGTNAQIDKGESIIEDLKIEVKGKIPEDVPIKMNEAARKGVEWISTIADTNISLKDCQITMSYITFGGTTKGSWRGEVKQGDLEQYIFFINSLTGNFVSQLACLRTEKNEAWLVTDMDGKKYQMIDDNQLAPFSNVEVVLNAPMEVSFVRDKEAGVNLNYENEDYSFIYEVKDNTLYIKDEKNKHPMKKRNQTENNSLTVYIPENCKLNTMNLTHDTESIYIEDLAVDQIQVQGDTGSIHMKNIQNEKLEIKHDTGEIYLEEIKSQSIHLNNDTGAITVEKVECPDCLIEVDTGAIYLGKGLKGKIKVDTQTGAIFTEEKENNECTYELSSKVGAVLQEGEEEYFPPMPEIAEALVGF